MPSPSTDPHQFDCDKCIPAQLLGKMAKGKPKRFSHDELERRRESIRQINVRRKNRGVKYEVD